MGVVIITIKEIRDIRDDSEKWRLPKIEIVTPRQAKKARLIQKGERNPFIISIYVRGISKSIGKFELML